MFLPRLLVLALFASSALAIPVAPLPPQIAPMSTTDIAGDAETNGESTLVVWTAEFSPFRDTHSIAVRMLDSENDRLGVRVASGHTPHVATNGSEYLIAHSMSAPRFWYDDYYNVGIVLIKPDGTRAAAKNINYSRSGSAGGVTWNGSQWIVAFTAGNSARAAIIEPDLTMRFVDLGAGIAGDVKMIAGTTWIALENGTARELVELKTDGTVGRRHVVNGGDIRIVPGGDGALVFTKESNGVQVARFDPMTGIGASRLVGPDLVLHDAESWLSGAMLLLQPAEGTTAYGLLVDREGTPTEPFVLGTDFNYRRQLGRARDGLVLLESRGTTWLDVYLSRLTIPGPVDVGASLLVSVENIARQAGGVLTTADDRALAIWSQTIAPDGTMGMFRRWFDALGQPLGEPLQLPVTINSTPAVLFDGEKFLISWTDQGVLHLARLSADGNTLSEPFLLGLGNSPALARSGDALFLAWRGWDEQVWGTPLNDDGAPVVPNGFPILRNLSWSQGTPRIAAHPRGFQLLWTDPDNVTSVVISPQGTPLSATPVVDTPAHAIVFASSTNSALAAWVSSYDGGPTLYAFSADAPFESFDPHWGERWLPLAILPIGPDVYLSVIARDGFLFTSEVTMSSGFITGISPLVPIASVGNLDVSVARPGQRTLILRPVGNELHLDVNASTKRRAAGRR